MNGRDGFSSHTKESLFVSSEIRNPEKGLLLYWPQKHHHQHNSNSTTTTTTTTDMRVLSKPTSAGGYTVHTRTHTSMYDETNIYLGASQIYKLLLNMVMIVM